jgi:hypothetical protein
MISTLIANPFFGEKLIYVSFFVLVCAEGVGVHIDAKFRVQKVSLQKKEIAKRRNFVTPQIFCQNLFFHFHVVKTEGLT